jgi:hypothetical protein
MLHTFRGSLITRLIWNYGMMASMEHISLKLYELLQFLLLHLPLLLQVPLLQPMILFLSMHVLLLLVHVLLLLVGMHLQLLPSHLELPLIGARSRTFSSGASRLSFLCAAPMTLLSTSLIIS